MENSKLLLSPQFFLRKTICVAVNRNRACARVCLQSMCGTKLFVMPSVTVHKKNNFQPFDRPTWFSGESESFLSLPRATTMLIHQRAIPVVEGSIKKHLLSCWTPKTWRRADYAISPPMPRVFFFAPSRRRYSSYRGIYYCARLEAGNCTQSFDS